MRITWTGALTFGLVNLPVGLSPATQPAARASDVSFRMLHRECGSPLTGGRTCPKHQRVVGEDEVVRGWEIARGQFLLVEEAELEAIEDHHGSHEVLIVQFVDETEVDPVFFDRTYFLVPPEAPAARRPYALLLDAMRETGTAALGVIVERGKERFCLIRPKGGALAMEMLHLAMDVYSQAEIDEMMSGVKLNPVEQDLARTVIESLRAPFDPLVLHSSYRERLRAMLEAKASGDEVLTPEVLPDSQVVDLMEALRRSVEEAKASRPRTRTDA